MARKPTGGKPGYPKGRPRGLSHAYKREQTRLVLILLSQGKSSKYISKKLGISVTRVNAIKRQYLARRGLKSPLWRGRRWGNVEGREKGSLGHVISEIRAKTGLTQAKFAAALGITPYQISRLENNKSVPSVALLKGIAHHGLISVDELLKRVSIKPKVRVGGVDLPLVELDADLLAKIIAKEIHEAFRLTSLESTMAKKGPEVAQAVLARLKR